MKMICYFTVITFSVCTFVPDTHAVNEATNFLTDMNQLFEWHFRNLKEYSTDFIEKIKLNNEFIKTDYASRETKWANLDEFLSCSSKIDFPKINKAKTKKMIEDITNKILKKYTCDKDVLNNRVTKINEALFNSYLNTGNQIYKLVMTKCEQNFIRRSFLVGFINLNEIDFNLNSIDLYIIVHEMINRPLLIQDFVMINPIHEGMPLSDKRGKEINMVDLNLKRHELIDIKYNNDTFLNKLKNINTMFTGFIDRTNKTIKDLENFLCMENKQKTEENFNEITFNHMGALTKQTEKELNIPQDEVDLTFESHFKKSIYNLHEDLCKCYNNLSLLTLDALKIFDKHQKDINKENKQEDILEKQKKDPYKEEKPQQNFENIKEDFNSFYEELTAIKFKYEFVINTFIDAIYDKLKNDEFVEKLKSNKIYIKNEKIKVDLHHFIQLDKLLNHVVINDNGLYVKYDIFDKFYNENNTILDEKTFLEHYGIKTPKLLDQKRLLDLFSEILIYFEQFECKTEALEKIYNNMNSQIEKIKKRFEDFEAKIKPNYKIITEFVYKDILESFGYLVLNLQTINDFILKEYSTSEEDIGLKEKINQNQTDLITLKKQIDEMKNQYPKKKTETNSGSSNNTPKPEVSKATENNNKETDGFSTKQIVLFVAGCLFLIGLMVLVILKMRTSVRK